MSELDAAAIIKYIGTAPKTTNVKVYIKGKLAELTFPQEIKAFTDEQIGILFGDWAVVKPFFSPSSGSDCRLSSGKSGSKPSGSLARH
nr:hypothetical protein [Fructilactobacillus florum]